MNAILDKLPANPRLRGLAVGVAALLATLLVTQVLMPGKGGQRGTPGAILYSGLATGFSLSLIAVGFVFVYRTMRIVNFAQAALGIFGGVTFWDLLQYTDLPFVVCLVIGVATAALAGLVVGLFTLRFFNGSRLFLTVVTIVVAQAAAGFAPQIKSLAFTPHPDERTTAETELAQNPDALLPFSGWDYTIGSLEVPFGFAEVLAFEIAIIGLLALGAFFAFTRSGIAVRGLAENSERASLLGISTGKLSLVIWTIAGALSGMGIIVFGALDTPGRAEGFALDALFPPMAAAVIVGMRSIPAAALTAVIIGILQVSWDYNLAEDTAVFDALLLIAVLVGLAVQRRKGRSEKAGATSWAATDEIRPVPAALLAVPGVRYARSGLLALGLLVLALFPFLVGQRNVVLGQTAAIFAIVAVSLIVLTGWSGQVSLGQFGFVGIGAVVSASLTVNTPLPFWLAVPLGAVLTGLVAVAIGIPALRIHGLFLLVATFGLAVAVREVLFDDKYFGWLLPDAAIERPTLFFIDFEDETSMYFLCVAALAFVVWSVTNLRKTRVGRILIAVRENEESLSAFGVAVVRTKLLAFGISGMIAGFAGGLTVHQARALEPDDFTALQSITVFIMTIIGGIGSVAGALVGALYYTLTTDLIKSPLLFEFFQLGGALFILFAFPGGLISLFSLGRDGVLRIIAQRQHIVVPSLTRGYEEVSGDRQLVPLAEPESGAGLQAIEAGRRWSRPSELYRWRRSEAVTARADRDALAAVGALDDGERIGQDA